MIKKKKIIELEFGIGRFNGFSIALKTTIISVKNLEKLTEKRRI